MRLRLLAVASILCAATPAEAASCNLIKVHPLRFGRYEPRALQGAESDARIMLLCKDTRPADTVRILIDQGIGGSGWQRQMSSGTWRLGYQLYLDAARTQIWGDGTGGTGIWQAPSPLPNGAIQVPVYGFIPAGQYVLSGTYTDTLTVTVEF